jgi:hypothetical protein
MLTAVKAKNIAFFALPAEDALVTTTVHGAVPPSATGMTITSVRFYFYPNSARRERKLTTTLWGFAEWFEYRLKPIREELRGPEAKGVNIMNFSLYEDLERTSRHDVWWHRGNTFEYGTSFDLASLSAMHRVKAVDRLMAWAAPVALAAPWPQAVAVGRALSTPLSQQEKEDILPYLQWPRGEIKPRKTRPRPG